MAQPLILRREKTSKNSIVDHIDNRHVSLENLKERLDDLQQHKKKVGEVKMLKYLEKNNIPNYPNPEFSVSRLKHETKLDGLRGIQGSGGFEGSKENQRETASGGDENPALQWWSLLVGSEEVRAAEEANQGRRLMDFATSPAFAETSWLGSFRFTFTVQEVLGEYKKQICSGEEPVMRVYGTSLFPQNIQYTILIHSPQHNNTFSMYPLLEDEPGAVCCYRDQRFIWKSQAMCATHSYELTYDGQAATCGPNPEYYVYDSVAIALHMEQPQVLAFDQDILRMNLKFCHPSPRSKGNIFTRLKYAKDVVSELWPYHEGILEEERSLEEQCAGTAAGGSTSQ